MSIVRTIERRMTEADKHTLAGPMLTCFSLIGTAMGVLILRHTYAEGWARNMIDMKAFWAAIRRKYDQWKARIVSEEIELNNLLVATAEEDAVERAEDLADLQRTLDRLFARESDRTHRDWRRQQVCSFRLGRKAMESLIEGEQLGGDEIRDMLGEEGEQMRKEGEEMRAHLIEEGGQERRRIIEAGKRSVMPRNVAHT